MTPLEIIFKRLQSHLNFLEKNNYNGKQDWKIAYISSFLSKMDLDIQNEYDFLEKVYYDAQESHNEYGMDFDKYYEKYIKNGISNK